MTTQEKLDVVIKELIEKNPSIFALNQKNKVSSILLFKDYIFRLRLWKERLNKEYRPFGRSINGDFQNIISDININLLEDQKISFNYIRDKLNKTYSIKKLPTRVINNLFIYLFIYWEAFKNREEIAKHNDLPHPYEGIIKMFRNDHIFTSEGINIAHVTMRHSSCINLRLPSIEDDFLNYIDSKCKLSLTSGIPNQEEVNQLWEDFQKIEQNG